MLADAGFELRPGGLESTREQLMGLVRGAVAIVADPSVPIDSAVLDRAGPDLRIVANFAVGTDNVDLEECRRRGIIVTNTPGVLTNATAELALTLTMAAARLTSQAELTLRAGLWRGWDPAGHLGLELSGATFGIAGLGRIGQRYAELIRPLAGRILYVARTPKPEVEQRLGAEHCELDDLLTASDVVSLHVPGGPETSGMLDGRRLALMQSHAILINTGRGTLVDAGALASALAAGDLGAAGLDVYENEPEVPSSLLGAPRCVLLPHIGSATTKARAEMARMVAREVIAVSTGGDPVHRVV